jgi:hypothetical protein
MLVDSSGFLEDFCDGTLEVLLSLCQEGLITPFLGVIGDFEPVVVPHNFFEWLDIAQRIEHEGWLAADRAHPYFPRFGRVENSGVCIVVSIGEADVWAAVI